MSNDLASLFPGHGADRNQVRIRQGVVVAWDSSTGANTINVGGAELTNLPFEIAASSVLVQGDVVQLTSNGGKWYITGKITDPGESDIVPTWTGDIANLNDVVVPEITANVLTAQTTADTAQTTATTAQSAADDAAAAAAAAQAAADALQADLDTAEADVAAAQADIDALTGTTLPALQTQVDAILPITETDISDDAITTPKIAANAITAAEIEALAVTTEKLAAGAVTAEKIEAGTVTATEIAAGAITAAKIAADAIDGKTITGALFRTAATGQRVEIDSVSAVNQIQFFSGSASETAPGYVESDLVLGDAFTKIASPATAAGATPAKVSLSNNASTGTTNVTLSADEVELVGDVNIQNGASGTGILIRSTGAFRISASGDPLVIESDTGDIEINAGITGSGIDGDIVATGVNFTYNGSDVVTDDASQILTNKDLSSSTNTFPATSEWTNLPLANAWVSDTGRTAQYCKDMTGRVQLRGRVKSGTNTLPIATLPLGFRPTQTMEWTLRGAGGIIVCAIEVRTDGTIVAVGNSGTVSSAGGNIDCISFPTN